VGDVETAPGSLVLIATSSNQVLLPSAAITFGGSGSDRTVSLSGTLFEVDAALVGQTVTLRHDPSAPASRGIEVWHDARFVERARPLDAYANCFVRRNRPTQGIEADTPAPAPRPGGLSLRDLRGHKPEDKPDDQERR
jgi:hypothetical protein